MTNLEYYKDEIEERFKQLFKSFTDTSSLACALDETYLKHRKQKYGSMFTWYFEEHKEPIKLKQWEYDLIETCYKCSSYLETDTLNSYNFFKSLKEKGHLRGIDDLKIRIEEILDNCEVIE